MLDIIFLLTAIVGLCSYYVLTNYCIVKDSHDKDLTVYAIEEKSYGPVPKE